MASHHPSPQAVTHPSPLIWEEPVNTLRQDVFHSYPVRDDQVVRSRPNGQLILIHSDRLNAARHRFDKATEEGSKLFEFLWPSSLARPGFSIGLDSTRLAGM